MDYTLIDFEEVKKLLDDLGWEHDRMSSSGLKTFDKLCKIFGLMTTAEADYLISKVEGI